MGRGRARSGWTAGVTAALVVAATMLGGAASAPAQAQGAAKTQTKIQAPAQAQAQAKAALSNPGPSGDPAKGTRRVVFVGNNWDGTADVIAARSFKRLGRLDVVPDYDERMQEIASNPYRLAYFLAIRTAIGEGNDQFVDDMYSSNDGRLVVISRPSFADVVAISLDTKKIVWRFEVDGVRSDHMAISPDGRRVVVSASTGNVVHVLRVKDGKQVGKFVSGGSPHENVFIDGGKRILHASIGTVYSPLDDPDVPDPLEGERVLQVVNAKTFEIERRYNVRKALDAAGLDKVSISVRPLTLSPNEKWIYFQLSFFHGFVEFNRRSGKITRVKRLPNLVKDTPREEYVLDSAHHGIAMNPKGTRICVAGTMSDYATIVRAKSFKRTRLLKGGEKPYWVTPSWNGKYCYISWSGTDSVSRISYRKARIVDTIDVGNHPQRIRNGFIKKAFVRDLGNAEPRVPVGTTG